MEYTLKIFGANDKLIGQDAANLINSTFNLNLTWEAIVLNTFYNNSLTGSLKSFYVGAFIKNEIIGFVAFKSHDFIKSGTIINCFHHCIVCTSHKHKGKGVFQNILKFGKEYLKDKNIGFIYGIPNNNSGPIFYKLGYKHFGPFLKVNAFNIPILFSTAFKKWKKDSTLYSENAFFQNEYQLIDSKSNEKDIQILVHEDLGNVIWGRIVKRKVFFFTISYFSVGGMIINKPYFFKRTVERLVKKWNVHFIQFLFHETSFYKELFTSPKVAPFVEPFVVDEMNLNLSKEDIFNFMPGIKNNF